MNKCPSGYVCFNREIFIIIAIFIIGLAMYGFNNKESLGISAKIPNTSTSTTINSTENRGNSVDQLKIEMLENQLKTQASILKDQSTTIRNLPNTDPQINIISSTVENMTPHQQEIAKIYDPLSGPERQYPYVMSKTAVPINMATRGYVTEYQQLGALYSIGNGPRKTRVLPLYGKPTYPGSNKWLYYTGTDDYHTVKIPIFKEGRKCGGDFGCDELYTDDLVNVSPYNCKFKVELYDLEKPRYLPNIIY